MNAKHGSVGQSVLVGLIVVAGGWCINKVTDNRDETTTAAAIATLTERVSTLTDQVRQLNVQPYVRREEYSGEITRLDRRLDALEQRRK